MSKSILDAIEAAQRDIQENCSCDLEGGCRLCIEYGFLFGEHIRDLVDIARLAIHFKNDYLFSLEAFKEQHPDVFVAESAVDLFNALQKLEAE